MADKSTIANSNNNFIVAIDALPSLKKVSDEKSGKFIYHGRE